MLYRIILTQAIFFYFLFFLSRDNPNRMGLSNSLTVGQRNYLMRAIPNFVGIDQQEDFFSFWFFSVNGCYFLVIFWLFWLLLFVGNKAKGRVSKRVFQGVRIRG